MKDLEGVEKNVMHACGHDMHIVALLAAAETLARAKDSWSGTLVLVFQPAEEKAGGAQAMVDDGLYEKVPAPDVVVGAHVMPERAGVIGTKRGLIASSADSFQYVHLYLKTMRSLKCVADSTSKDDKPTPLHPTEASTLSSKPPRP